MAKEMELHITEGPLAGQRVAVPAAGLRFGRSSSNDLHIPDGELSRTHCLFEVSPEGRLLVTDLASANGTFVNSRQLGAEPFALKAGDVIDAGTTRLVVVDPSAPPPSPESAPTVVSPAAPKTAGEVDLGLAGGSSGGDRQDSPDGPARKRSLLINALWAVAALSAAVAMAIILFMPTGTEDPAQTAKEISVKRAPDPVSSVFYEKVEADATRIFRYQMTIDDKGVLRVVYDDVPGEDRHVDKSAQLSPKALAHVAEIFASKGWKDLDPAYTGYVSDDDNVLKSRRLRVTSGKTEKEVTVENMPEPEPLMAVISALEAFSRNELGVWALQYSRDQLLKLSQEVAHVGDMKWEDRNVEYGNLSACVKAYREAMFYLETVNPKPESYSRIKTALADAEAELDKRYRDQRFEADKAINLADWGKARAELRTLCELIPDKSDERHIEANAKLVDVERRLGKGGKEGRR